MSLNSMEVNGSELPVPVNVLTPVKDESGNLIEKVMEDICNVDVNGTESEVLNLSLNSDFVYDDDELTVPVRDNGESESGNLIGKVVEDISNVEVNGIESDEVNLRLHEVVTDFVYNEEELPVTVTVLSPVKDAGESECGNLIGKVMNDISNVEVNGTELEEVNLTLHEVESDFVYNEEELPVTVTTLSPVKDAGETESECGNLIGKVMNDISNVEVNGTELDELDVTLHEVESDFVYNEEEMPVTVTVLSPVTTQMKDAGESECGNSINMEVNGTESEELNLTLHEVESDFVYNEEELPVTVTVLPPVKDNAGVSDLDLSPENGVRSSPQVSPVSCSQNDGPSLKRNIDSCKKGSSRKNKKQRKGKKVCLFVGEPVSETEAKERWGWRYELKGQIGKGKSCVLNAGEEDEVHLNVACHYLQADVIGCIYSLGDCAHIKGEGKQQHVGRIVEFFKTSDDENYFRVQWFFRAEDTVMKEAAAFHDKKRLFFSTLMNDNLLECILSKVKIIEKAPTLGFQSTSIKPSEYYCDMEYSVKYSTFRSLVPATDARCDLTMPSSLDANNMSISSNPVDLSNCEIDKPELVLLDLYAGCGGMSTGLCLGAKLSGVKLVTRWAIDYQKSACDSLKLNHPETDVRHSTAEDFLELLKEWEKLCKLYVLSDPDKMTESSLGGEDESKINESTVSDADVAPGEYEVSSLVDICYGDPSNTGEHGLKFKVRWKGYGPSDDTWELIEGLSDCQGHIQDFVRSGYKSKILPCPGDVDVICGGPPCQGISGYNRFRNTDDPLNDERNQQIVVFFDIVKFLNPKYVLMENVADILRFDKASLGRYALSRLVHMNYQARLGIMAAGSYGLPQFRLRVFLWGAHPNERLPQFPLPTHEVIVRYFPPAEFEQNTVAYDEGQPRKLQDAIVLRDAISDLPAVTSFEEREEMAYEMPPETEFQKYIRLTKDEFNGSVLKGVTDWKTSVLTDHRPYKISENDYHRLCYVPHRKGANFRDFPGIIVTRENVVKRDPTKAQVLLPSGKPLIPDYVFTFEKGKSKRPFARVWWDENVPTVVTFPNLRNQAALHPEQDRVLTLREYARLQGFPDHYRFCGNVKERYCQVGNAVAVSVSKTLGYALGMAFRKQSGDEALMTLPPDFACQITPI